MLVTNHEEYQQQAIELGAVRGFGKASLWNAKTAAALQAFLD